MKPKQEDESSDPWEKQQNSLLKQQPVVPLTILCFMHPRWEETAFYKIKACNAHKREHSMCKTDYKRRQHVPELKADEGNMSIQAGGVC